MNDCGVSGWNTAGEHKPTGCCRPSVDDSRINQRRPTCLPTRLQRQSIAATVMQRQRGIVRRNAKKWRRRQCGVLGATLQKSRPGRFYVAAGGHVPPQIHLSPQIQKLADCADVISEVPKCSEIQIFRGPGGVYSAFPPLSAIRLTHYRVGKPADGIFQL